MHNEKLPICEYEKLKDTFNPAQFDAGEWCRTFREAGAKYVTFTTKHHDGFCMFDLEELVTHKWQLDEVQEALEYASKRPGDYIKGVIIP